MDETLKPCKQCGNDFEPRNSLDKFCAWKCALESVREKRKKKEKKLFNAETRRLKEAAKTRRDYLREAQKSFNAFIRARDRGIPCISCNRTDMEVEGWMVGGKWDCGHFLTRGAHPELRFNTWGAHKQCKSCNGGSGRFAKKNKTVSATYRINLIKKIGIEKVEWLEGAHELVKHDIEYLKRVKRIFNKRCINLKKRYNYT